MESIEPFTTEPRFAYFSMEIALRPEIPTYSGGLGVLAGDTLRSAADLALPLVAVTLVSRAGYFRQTIDANGAQVEQPDPWDPAQHATRLRAGIAVPIDGHDVWIGAWLFIVSGRTSAREPVILLDTDLALNRPEDRLLTHYLYGGDQAYRLKQEIILGLGGARMLQALGFNIRKYHMNEGHSALLALELMQRYAYSEEDLRPGDAAYDVPRVRSMCVFTTHTPVSAGQDQFPYDLVTRMLGDYVDLPSLKALGGNDVLNMTRLALNLSEYVNGVAERHAETSRRLFPGRLVHAITNGVHPTTWTGASFAALYDHYVPGWQHESQLLMRADRIPDNAIWQAHTSQKQVLIDRVKIETQVQLDPSLPIIGFARRMTEYKRPDLLFTDLDRLRAIARKIPFQLVLAGKAHPRDTEGKRLIERLRGFMRELKDDIRIAYLPNYNIDSALAMVSGADLWLNTPLRPLEASGTSGMKAAFNGVPSLSVLDGWWVEGCIEGSTGWAIGNGADLANHSDQEDLYQKLEQTVLPLYALDRAGWIAVMKGAIAKNASYFNSHRMMRRYVTEAYIR
jgi:glycogen phosphorylase